MRRFISLFVGTLLFCAQASAKGRLTPEEMLAEGEKYEKGMGVNENQREAFRLYSQAAKEENAQAALRLADMYRFGRGQMRNDAQMRVNLINATPNPLAKDKPPVLPKDDAKAAYWYRKAAKAGEPRACMMLAVILKEEDKNEEARKWMIRAAEKNYEPAFMDLSYIAPRGLAKNKKEAHEWKKRGARAKIAILELDLAADLLKAGDSRNAIDILEVCGHRGITACQMALAAGYRDGQDGFSQDLPRAVEWYRKAGTNGVPEAWMDLALIYYRGDGGVLVDRVESYRWMLIAGPQWRAKSEEVQTYFSQLEKDLTKREKAEARRRMGAN